MCKTSIKKNLYYEIKDKVFEESYNGVHVARKKARVKVYGTDSTKEVRARMIELLYERMDMHKDKFVSKILLNELRTLEVDKHGKVQAVSPNHDDQVFSYLHAIRVWYDGEELAERYNIRKNTIRTDEDVEIEESNLEQMEFLQKLDLESVTRDTPDANPNELTGDDLIAAQLEAIEKQRNIRSETQYNTEVYEEDEEAFRLFLQLNKDARSEYNKKYHVDESNMMDASPTIQLPDALFGSATFDPEEEALERQRKLNGNMFDIFSSL